jgi:uncharacterized membrane protein YcjF (UPF0283 family)
VTSLLYIVQSLPWIVAGLLVGFFVGRATVAVEVVTEAAQGEGDVMRDSSTPKKRWMRITTNGVIAFLLIVLGVATAVQSYVQSEATARLTECQTAYANGFADALDARSQATSEAQNALDELLSTVAAITPTPEGRNQFREALADYLKKRAEAKKTQQEHPFPPAPRDVCKETG